MYKKLMMIAALAITGLHAETTLQKAGQLAWKIVKPFDIIHDDYVTEFTPHGREYKSMYGIKINGILPCLKDPKNKHRYFFQYALDNNYQPTDTDPAFEAYRAEFNEYKAKHQAKLQKEGRVPFSIHNQSPEKEHIVIFWYDALCYPMRTMLKGVHYWPTSAGFTLLKYVTLAALAEMGIEKAAKCLKKKRANTKETVETELLIEKI